VCVSLGSGKESLVSDEACFGLSVIWAGLEGVKGGSDSQRVLLVCVSYRSDYSYQSYTSAL
jgi:hypothetical protein